MIPLSKHVATILDRDGIPLPVEPVEVSLTLDDDWSPYIQGRLVVHASDRNILDREYCRVRLRQTFGSDLSVAAITEWLGGSVSRATANGAGRVRTVTERLRRVWNLFERMQPLRALTALWGGSVAAVTSDDAGKVAAITKRFRKPGGAYDVPPPQVIEVLARVRPASVSRLDMLIEYTIDGEDIALHDFRRASTSPYVSTQTTLQALCSYVVGLAGGTLSSSGTVTIATGLEWKPGATAWEFLHPILEATDYRLYADGEARYRLVPRTTADAPEQLHYDRNLIDYDEAQEPPYEGAVVEYTGGETPVYDYYARPGAKRILYEIRDSSWPGIGAASALVARSLTRGHTAIARATNLYNLRPLNRINVTPGDDTQRGTITAVTWTYPESEMRVRLRDLSTL